MKKLFISVFIALCYFASSQTLDLNKSLDLNYTSQIANTDKFESIILKDGSSLAIGDTIKVGSTLNMGPNYSNMYFGKVNFAKMMLSPPVAMPSNAQGSLLIITDIFAKHTKMSKKSPVTCMLYVQDYQTTKLAANRSIFNLSIALETGEIINLNASLTKSQAMTLLKEKKDLLDLGIISQEEFDKVKNELTPILLGK